MRVKARDAVGLSILLLQFNIVWTPVMWYLHTSWSDQLNWPLLSPPSVCYWETTKRYVMSQQGSLTPGHDLCLSQTTVTWWLYELVIQMCMYRVWLYMCTSPSLLSERQVVRSTGITSHHSLCQKLYDRLSWPRRMTIK